jgi:hypothetical protein
MASDSALLALDDVAQPKKNLKIVRYIVGAAAAGAMLGAAITFLNNNFVVPEVASGASGPVELSSVGASPLAKGVVVFGGAYHPPNSMPFAENYHGKLGDSDQVPSLERRVASLESQFAGASSAPASFSAAPSGGFSAEQLAFMERQKALRGGASPAAASFSPAPSGGAGFSAEQLAFMERQIGARDESSSSAVAAGFAPQQSKAYGNSYRR